MKVRSDNRMAGNHDCGVEAGNKIHTTEDKESVLPEFDICMVLVPEYNSGASKARKGKGIGSRVRT